MPRRTITIPWGGQRQRFADVLAEWGPDNPHTLFLADDPDPDAAWQVAVVWEVADARAVPVEVHLISTRGQPVTPAVWRSVRVADAVEDTRLRLQHVPRTLARLARDLEKSRKLTREADALAGQDSRRAKGRPRHHTDEHFQRVADLYTAAVQAGSTRPQREVATRLAADFPEVTDPGDRRVKGWIATARRLGLISVHARPVHTTQEA